MSGRRFEQILRYLYYERYPCESDKLFKGKQHQESDKINKTHSLLLRLMAPYLNKGHHLFMDNFYNSVYLSQDLLKHKTHCAGTLRCNRKRNPSITSYIFSRFT
jgi:hypothetical protein